MVFQKNRCHNERTGLKEIDPRNRKRIFWLGAHKVLVQTELVRLRRLGFEVFNPPYLSSCKDQSADSEWDNKQPTTLPDDVFKRLSGFNFFYNTIPAAIGNLLSRYFDAVIVTISPDWLDSILSSTYKGKVIYRTYGQVSTLSEAIKKRNLLIKISCHEDFAFLPHAQEALEGEHRWLRELAQVTPYCLTEDVFSIENSWNIDAANRLEIMLTCPIINNRFYRHHYKFLKKNFNENHYGYYGGQHSRVKDPRVIGTLPRQVLLERFRSAAGYLYTYRDPYVCYLPPIEMMVIGGPVLFLTGSLLDKFFDDQAPGRCRSIQEAKEKVARLLAKDRSFINAIIASQKTVGKRYTPDYVWPVFDRHMTKSLTEKVSSKCLITDRIRPSSKERIYLLHHFPNATILFKDKRYIAFDGIVRVMRLIVQALSAHTDVEIVITAWYREAESVSGYFNDFTNGNKNRIRVLVVDTTNRQRQTGQCLQRIKGFVKKYAPHYLWPMLSRVQTAIYRAQELMTSYRDRRNRGAFSQALDYVDAINRDVGCKKVIVPLYFSFPEALAINKDLYMYLPDYMPHFFHGSTEFKREEGIRTKIGKMVAKKAKVVFCHSYFTKNYLPDSRLEVDKEKIRVFFLPHLNQSSQQEADRPALPAGLTKERYIFYPTQARPNKNLSLLLKVFDRLVGRDRHLQLVLTTSLFLESKAYRTYRSLPPTSRKRILFKEKISDDLLEVLYRNAALLCFTSLAEGNFPPQIQEALCYKVPIVASDLQFITERIPPHLEDSLRLCRPNNLTDFVNGCEEVLKNRGLVLQKQQKLYAHIKQDEARFSSDVINLIYN
ncbi:MAG: glycosyltransferase [Chlamydiota bacterium]